MANTIRIKRSTTTAVPSSLAQGELAYSESGGVGEGELFIGVAGPGIEKIGGYKDVQKLLGIEDNANNYVHPTGSGSEHLPAGGSANNYVKWSAAGTGQWADFATDVAATAAVAANTAKETNATHTGDVTGSGALTIANNAVTLAKMADIATASLIGRTSASTGDPEVLSAAQVRTLLNVADGANNYVHPTSSGNIHLPAGGATGDYVKWQAAGTGQWSSFATDVAATAAVAANTAKVTNATHTGDVTGSVALTIANNAVTLAKMADIASDRILGRVSASTGDPEVLTAAQVRTMLNVADGADITNATTVEAAGAVMESDTSTAAMSFVIDEDTMASNSATKVPTQQSVKAYVDSVVVGGMVYRGAYNASTNSPDLDVSPTGVSQGDTYTVTAAGNFFTEAVEVGDMLVAEVNSASTLADWTIVQRNIGAASTTVAGYVELATVAETNTGTDATRAVTPDGLDGWTGSSQLTTLGTITTGIWQGTAIGASYLPSASISAKGIIELATQAEVDGGSDTTRAVVPAYLHNTTLDGGTF